MEFVKLGSQNITFKVNIALCIGLRDLLDQKLSFNEVNIHGEVLGTVVLGVSINLCHPVIFVCL